MGEPRQVIQSQGGAARLRGEAERSPKTAGYWCARGRQKKTRAAVSAGYGAYVHANIPIRGHSHAEGNFQQLFGYLCRHRTKFTSVGILNEMCELIGISTIRLLSEHFRNNKLAFMIDETPDASRVKQMAVVDQQLTPEEIFLGWHATVK